MHEVGLFGFLLIGTVCVSWVCVTFSLIQLGKFSIITFSSTFSIPCSSSSPLGIPLIQISLCFMLSYSSLTTCSFLLSLFSFSCSFWVFSFTLSCNLLIRSSALSTLLVIPSSVLFYFWDFIVHFFLDFVFRFSFFFHTVVGLTQFLVAFCEFLEHLYNHYFEFYIIVCLPPFHLALLLGSLPFL